VRQKSSGSIYDNHIWKQGCCSWGRRVDCDIKLYVEIEGDEIWVCSVMGMGSTVGISSDWAGVGK
jgi:hypothetical protein